MKKIMRLNRDLHQLSSLGMHLGDMVLVSNQRLNKLLSDFDQYLEAQLTTGGLDPQTLSLLKQMQIPTVTQAVPVSNAVEDLNDRLAKSEASLAAQQVVPSDHDVAVSDEIKTDVPSQADSAITSSVADSEPSSETVTGDDQQSNSSDDKDQDLVPEEHSETSSADDLEDEFGDDEEDEMVNDDDDSELDESDDHSIGTESEEPVTDQNDGLPEDFQAPANGNINGAGGDDDPFLAAEADDQADNAASTQSSTAPSEEKPAESSSSNENQNVFFSNAGDLIENGNPTSQSDTSAISDTVNEALGNVPEPGTPGNQFGLRENVNQNSHFLNQ